MKLRNKILLFLFVTMSLFIYCLYLVSSNVLLRGFVEIEDSLIAQNTGRFREIFSNEEEVLKTTSVGWSTWDDTYNYVSKPNDKYLKNNFIIDSFFDNKINEIVIFDLNDKTLFAKAYNLEERKFEKSSTDKIKFFIENILTKRINKTATIPLTGLYIFNNTPIVFSLNPILPGSGQGPPNGFLLFERNVESTTVDRLGKIIKFNLNHKIVGWDHREKINYIKGARETIAQMYFPDILDKNALLINMPMPRTIFQFGEKTINKYFLILFLCSLLLVVAVYFLFNRYVVKRILRIRNELKLVSEHYASNKRVTPEGSDEIEDLALNINSALDTIDRNQSIINRSSKLTALGEIAASIAHEINNPLTVIGGYSSKITSHLEADQVNKEYLKNYAAKISSGIIRIAKIIHSLKVISQDGESDLKTNVLSGDLLDDILPVIQNRIKALNIQLDLTAFALDISLEIRAIQITQVLVNLINNSIDAIADDPNPWIKVSLKKTDHEIEILVIDSGKNISPEIAENVMNPFFTTKPAGKGTGLGLSISKKFIESHLGQLTLITTPHTCFKITIPQ